MDNFLLTKVPLVAVPPAREPSTSTQGSISRVSV